MNRFAAQKSVRRPVAKCDLATGLWSTNRTSTRATRPRGRRLGLERLEDRALLSAGDLDLTFGDGGLVTTDIGAFPSSDFAYDLAAVQADGKIVVAGTTYVTGSSTDSDFAVARYNSDGSLDTSFGTGGRVVTDLFRYQSGDNWPSDDQAQAVAIQTDGKILVAGYSYQVTYQGTQGWDFAIVRYNSDGTLDTSFGVGGTATADLGSVNDYAYGIAVDAAGKLVLAGCSGHDFGVARFNSDGSLDTDFDDDGRVITDVTGGSDDANGLAIQADGKIVVAGRSYRGDVTGYDFALARYNIDGSLDTSFGTDGKVTTDFAGGSDEVTGVAIQGDGQIVVAGKRVPRQSYGLRLRPCSLQQRWCPRSELWDGR